MAYRVVVLAALGVALVGQGSEAFGFLPPLSGGKAAAHLGAGRGRAFLSALPRRAVAPGGVRGLVGQKKALQNAGLEDLRAVMCDLLQEQWAAAAVLPPESQPIKESTAEHSSGSGSTSLSRNKSADVGREAANGTAAVKKGPKHVVGGFSVVLRLPEEGVAYRMQPMETFKAGMTWVAFHETIAEAAEDPKLVDEAMTHQVLFMPDRGLVLGHGRTGTKRSWDQSHIAREFQAARLRRSTKRLVRARRLAVAGGSEAFKRGDCESTMSCPIEPAADGGAFKWGGVRGGMLIPRFWFWYEVGRPDNDAPTGPTGKGGTGDGMAVSTEKDDPGQHRGGGGGGEPARRSRMKGIELADALLLPRQGGTRKGTLPAMPYSVEASPVRVLVSVFDHAQGDVGGLSKRLWSGGAVDSVSILVIQSVSRGLRTLHACGIPHGDLKPANVLYAGGQFCLTDMPALNWTATPVLTKDPVAHTMIRGKRFLCNDMWGLGMVSLGLICGHAKFEAVKTKLRGIDAAKFPRPLGKMDPVTSHWLVVVLLWLSSIDTDALCIPTVDEVAVAARRTLRSEWLGRQVPATRSRVYLDTCRGVADVLSEAVFRPGRRGDLIETLVYCLDVTDVSRNALAMPWPDQYDDEEGDEF